MRNINAELKAAKFKKKGRLTWQDLLALAVVLAAMTISF